MSMDQRENRLQFVYFLTILQNCDKLIHKFWHKFIQRTEKKGMIVYAVK